MSRIHPGGEVEHRAAQRFVVFSLFGECVEQAASLLARVENGERPFAWRRKHGDDQSRIVQLRRRTVLGEAVILHALEFDEIFASDFGDNDGGRVLKPELELIGFGQGRLGSGAKNK